MKKFILILLFCSNALFANIDCTDEVKEFLALAFVSDEAKAKSPNLKKQSDDLYGQLLKHINKNLDQSEIFATDLGTKFETTLISKTTKQIESQSKREPLNYFTILRTDLYAYYGTSESTHVTVGASIAAVVSMTSKCRSPKLLDAYTINGLHHGI